MAPSRALMLAAIVVGCAPSRETSQGPIATTRARLITPLTAMGAKRYRPAAALVADGKVLVAGGQSNDGTVHSTAEIFDRATGAWSPAKAMSTRRRGATATRLKDGRVLVAGGDDAVNTTSSAEIYDPSTDGWTVVGSMISSRSDRAAILLDDGWVLAAGGSNDEGSTTIEAESYNPATNAWAPVGSMKVRRGELTLVKLADGRVLFAGGNGSAALPEIFEPASRTFREIKSGLVRGYAGAATALGDGRVLVAGGSAYPNDFDDASLYDPSTDTVVKTTSLPLPRKEHTLTRLPGGGAVAIGGETAGKVLVFDPVTAGWLDGGFATSRRFGHVAIAFADGAVLVAGGTTNNMAFGEIVGTAEMFTVAAAGGACSAGVECTSGVCDGGRCSAATADAGPVTDAGPAAVPGTKVSGAFARCQKDADCASGHCSDGVCCDTACRDRCHSCVLPSSPGICTPEPIGVDLRGECGAQETCSGTCGPGGQCIGSTTGSMCARNKCTSATAGVGAAVCTASGALCPKETAVPFDCAPYVCELAFGACRTACVASADCANGFVCDVPTKTCTPSGTPPTDDGGCAMGHRSPSNAWIVALAFVAITRRRRS